MASSSFDAKQCLAVSSFLPRSVVQWIAERPFNEGAEVEEFTGVLMLVDISGFTKMSEQLSDAGPAGLETITKHLNSFFGQLIDIVDGHGGDVVKIAGDALLVTWKVENKQSRRRMSFQQKRMTLSTGDSSFVDRYAADSISAATIQAAVCAMSCVDLQRSYKIESPNDKRNPPQSGESGQLRLHCAMVCGKLYAVRCGGVHDVWDYLVCGDAIFESLRKALGKSKPGQVVVDKVAKSHINLWLDLNPTHQMEFEDYSDCKDVFLIKSISANFRRDQPGERIREVSRQDSLQSFSPSWESNHTRGGGGSERRSESYGSSRKLQTWINLLQLRSNDLATLKKYLPPLIKSRLEEAQYDCIPELRRCCILFVGIDSLHFQSVESISPMQQAFSCIQEVTYRMDGFIRQFIMDDKGCVAIVVFGAPGKAHDDDPSRAVETALYIFNELKDIGIDSSIGCTYGRVYFGDVGSHARREFALVGDVVNLAAHLMSKKLGILVEDKLHELSRSSIQFEKVNPVKVKGKDALVTVYKPIGIQRPTISSMDHFKEDAENSEQKNLQTRRAVNTLIGRDQELHNVDICLKGLIDMKSTCLRNIKLMMDNSTPRLKTLLICGENGMGKSMICENIVASSSRLGFHTTVNRNSYSDSSTPFKSWVYMLDSMLFSNGSYTPEQKQELLKQHISSPSLMLYEDQVGDDEDNEFEAPANLEQYVHLLYPLFQVGGGTRGAPKTDGQSFFIRIMLKHLFLIESLPYPRVVIMEDVERLDSASLELLQFVIKGQFPILFVLSHHVTSKEDRLPHLDKLFGSKCEVEKIYLSPLDQRATTDLTKAFLGIKVMPRELEGLILERTQGNPFVIGELCSALMEKGIIKVEADGSHTLRDLPNGDLPIPESVEAMVVQRIDKLGAQAMMALKVGSVFGMSFFINDITEIYPIHGERQSITKHLLKCVKSQLLDRSPSSGQYEFRSRVIHDTAYNMLLVTQRKTLHQAIAQRFETMQRRFIKNIYPSLAFHYANADKFDKAAVYYGQAGEQSLASFCLTESIRFLNEALALIGNMEESEQKLNRIRWLNSLGEAHKLKGAHTQASTYFKNALQYANFPYSQIGRFSNVLNRWKGFNEFLSLTYAQKHENIFKPVIKRDLSSSNAEGSNMDHRRSFMASPSSRDLLSPSSRDLTSQRPETSNSNINYSAVPTSEAAYINESVMIMAANIYSQLSQISIKNMNRSDVLYYAHEGLRISKQNNLIGPQLRIYSTLAELASLEKQYSYAKVYVVRIQRILARAFISGKLFVDAAQSLMRTAISNLYMGSLTLAHMHCKQGVNYAIFGSDLVTQVKLWSLGSFIFMLKGNPSECTDVQKKMRDAVSSLGDMRYREWYMGQAAFLCARYGIDSRYEIAAKLEKTLKNGRVEEEVGWKMDRCISVSALGLVGTNILVARQVVYLLCSLGPISPLLILANMASICALLRYMKLNQQEKSKAENGFTARKASMQMLLNHSRSKDDIPNQRQEATQATDAELVERLLAHMGQCVHVLDFARPIHERYLGAFELLKGNNARALAHFQRAYEMAQDYENDYEMLASSVEMSRAVDDTDDYFAQNPKYLQPEKLAHYSQLSNHLAFIEQQSVIL